MRLGITAVVLAVMATAASRSVWEGVFSKEQASRGRTIYRSQCARCHGEALLGGEDSPALADKEFLEKWEGKSVGTLVQRTRKTMPSDGPGKLSHRQSTDIIAYLLSENGFPAGKSELESESTAQDEILIQSKTQVTAQ